MAPDVAAVWTHDGSTIVNVNVRAPRADTTNSGSSPNVCGSAAGTGTSGGGSQTSRRVPVLYGMVESVGSPHEHSLCA